VVDVPDKDAPFRSLIDSTLAITFARFGMPVVVMLLGYLFSTMLSDLKTGQKEGLADLKDGQSKVWVQIGKVVEAQAATNSIQSGLSVQVANTSKQLDHLQTQVDGLKH
jgi:hypothetical protein